MSQGMKGWAKWGERSVDSGEIVEKTVEGLAGGLSDPRWEAWCTNTEAGSGEKWCCQHINRSRPY